MKAFLISLLIFQNLSYLCSGFASYGLVGDGLVMASVLPASSSSSLYALSQKNEYADSIARCNDILNRAAVMKDESSESVLSALEDLEKLFRQKRKLEGESVAKEVLKNLNGSWRLIFTTGTKSTQDKFKTKINYVPFKAIQSFNTTDQPYRIENGIYAWDFPVLKFSGLFDFDIRKSKLEFDFDQVSILGLPIRLKPTEAAKMGAASGLGNDGNIKRTESGGRAFFNWISADETIATARGGGGGLALWKRIID